MTKEPVPANSLSPCPFGGNPKVAAQMGFPSCGIARPGPFFADLNLGKQHGGRKSRRGRMRVKRGKFVRVGSRGSGIWNCHVDGRRCTRVKRGGRKSRRGGMQVKSGKFVPIGSRGRGKWRCVVNGRRCTRVKRGGRKSRRGGRKSRRAGRKSRRAGRKSRRAGRKSRHR